MLGLSAVAYRGFSDAMSAIPHPTLLHSAVTSALAEFAVTRDRWDVVWGPYRAPFSVLDDAMAFVTRRVDDPNRYVVAIRGTDPVSAFDWLFGDSGKDCSSTTS